LNVVEVIEGEQRSFLARFEHAGNEYLVPRGDLMSNPAELARTLAAGLALPGRASGATAPAILAGAGDPLLFGEVLGLLIALKSLGWLEEATLASGSGGEIPIAIFSVEDEDEDD
jgi:hypothetical protein